MFPQDGLDLLVALGLRTTDRPDDGRGQLTGVTGPLGRLARPMQILLVPGGEGLLQPLVRLARRAGGDLTDLLLRDLVVDERDCLVPGREGRQQPTIPVRCHLGGDVLSMVMLLSGEFLLDPGRHRSEHQLVGQFGEGSGESCAQDLPVAHLAENPCEPTQFVVESHEAARLEQRCRGPQRAPETADGDANAVHRVLTATQRDIAGEDGRDLLVDVVQCGGSGRRRRSGSVRCFVTDGALVRRRRRRRARAGPDHPFAYPFGHRIRRRGAHRDLAPGRGGGDRAGGGGGDGVVDHLVVGLTVRVEMAVAGSVRVHDRRDAKRFAAAQPP